MVYKLNRDAQEQVEQSEINFKTTLFASNIDLYNQVYSPENEENFDVTEIIPESEEDVEKMMAQLKRDGIIG